MVLILRRKMIFKVLIALIKRILKTLAIPFLWIWWLISWIAVLIIAPFVLIVELALSFKRGDWK